MPPSDKWFEATYLIVAGEGLVLDDLVGLLEQLRGLNLADTLCRLFAANERAVLAALSAADEVALCCRDS